MVEAITGRTIILIGVFLIIGGAAIFTESLISGNPIILLGFWIAYGGGFLCAVGVLISFLGDKYIKCRTCGARIKDDMYVCLNCNTKTPRYYHQKVTCRRCFKRTHYDKNMGRCQYCGNTLPGI